MRRRFFFLILTFSFLAVFLFSESGSVLAAPGSGSGGEGSPQGVNPAREKFDRLSGFLKDPEGNLFQWVGGQIIGEGSAEMLREHGFLGAVEYGILTQAIGISKDVGSSGGGSGGFNYVPSTVPMGAIIMPPGDWYFSGGMVGTTGNMIAATLSTPAASGVYYAYDVLNNLGVAPAYAAGGAAFGNSGGTLKPILGIWKAFRNVTYSLFAIIFVIVGLMVMFRVRTSPQTVITIETALPRVVGVLVLITFSYAIAGFMIDLMYVAMGVAINILKSNDMSPAFLFFWKPTPQNVVDSGFFALLPPLLNGFWGAGVLGHSIGAMMGYSLSALLGSGIIGNVVGLVAGGAGGVAGFLLFLLVWVIIVLFLFFRLLIALIKTYIYIILSIIFAPFHIMAGVLPNSATGFGSWLRGLTANLLVFPAVMAIMMIGTRLFSATSIGVGSLWYPPFLGAPVSGTFGLNIQGGLMNEFVKSIIGLGFLLILPSVPDIVRGAMGIKDSGIGAAVSQSLGPARFVGQTALQTGVVVTDQVYEQSGPQAGIILTVARGLGNALKVTGKAK